MGLSNLTGLQRLPCMQTRHGALVRSGFAIRGERVRRAGDRLAPSGNICPVSDEAVTRAAKTGDEASFVELMERHAPRMYAVALTITRQQADSEDAVQAACILAFKKLNQLKDDAAFLPWFRRIVVNEATNVIRRRRNQEVPIGYEAEQAPVDSPDADQRMDVQAAVDRLPAEHRRVVLLYYEAGLNAREIAESLRKPGGTVRRVLSEARHMLRHYLDTSVSADRSTETPEQSSPLQ